MSGQDPSLPLTDIERFGLGLIHTQYCQDAATCRDPESVLIHLNLASNLLGLALGLETEKGFEALGRLISQCIQVGRYEVVETLVQKLESETLNKTNFVWHTRAMRWLSESLRVRGLEEQRFQYLDKKLEGFLDAVDKLDDLWTFPFDPVLDVLEEMVFAMLDEDGSSTKVGAEIISRTRMNYWHYANNRYAAIFHVHLGLGWGVNAKWRSRRNLVDAWKYAKEPKSWNTRPLEEPMFGFDRGSAPSASTPPTAEPKNTTSESPASNSPIITLPPTSEFTNPPTTTSPESTLLLSSLPSLPSTRLSSAPATSWSPKKLFLWGFGPIIILAFLAFRAL